MSAEQPKSSMPKGDERDVDRLAFPTKSEGAYLRGTSVTDVLAQLQHLPLEARQHLAVFEQARVKRPENAAVAAKIKELSPLSDAELAAGLDAFLPADVAVRAEFFAAIASEQARALARLYGRAENYKQSRADSVVRHTVSPNFMASLWHIDESPAGDAALKAVPKERRAGWFERTLHHLAQVASDARVQELRQCLATPAQVPLARNTAADPPCAYQAIVVKSTQEHYLTQLTSGACANMTRAFREALVEQGDATQTRGAYGALSACHEGVRTMLAMNQAALHLSAQKKN